MLVTLIGKNILYKIKLPNKQTGNYWITDDDGKKILNIIGKNNEWQIYSNDQIKILDPRAIRSFNVSKVAKDVVNIISGVRLKENSIYLSDEIYRALGILKNARICYIFCFVNLYIKEILYK